MITGEQLVREYEKLIGKYSYDQLDCIGSIWSILKRYGAKTDLVGSNWFARYELRNMRPLLRKEQLYDGCAVLKTLLPGEAGWALPERYKGHVDQIDYNHIGIGTGDGRILDSTRYKDSKGNYIRNGPGVSTAKIAASSWDIIADFEDVDYGAVAPPDTEGAMSDVMRVWAAKGSTVNLRATPSMKDGVVIREKVPVHTLVEVAEAGPVWSKIRTRNATGWMLNEFLKAEGKEPAPEPSGTDEPGGESYARLLEEIEAAQAALDRVRKILKG